LVTDEIYSPDPIGSGIDTDTYRRVLELFDQWETDRPQPTLRVVELSQQLDRIIRVGDVLAGHIERLCRTQTVPKPISSPTQYLRGKK
jgi:hypothetical protein